MFIMKKSTSLTFKSLCVFLCFISLSSCAVEKTVESPVAMDSSPEQNIVAKEQEAPTEVSIYLEKPDIEYISPIQFHRLSSNYTFPSLYYENDVYSIVYENPTKLYVNDQLLCNYDFYLGYTSDIVLHGIYYSLVGDIVDENLHAQFTAYDLETGEKNILHSERMTNYRSYLYQISDTEIMFSYNGLTDDQTRCERTVVYDCVTKECRVISERNEYDWDKQSTTSREVSAVSGGENVIYLMQEQRIDGQTHHFITTINSTTGEQVSEEELSFLERYSKTSFSIDYFDIIDEFIFLRFYSGTKDELVIGKKINGSYREVEYDCEIAPYAKLTPFLISDRYVLFNATADDQKYSSPHYSADLWVFDIIEETYRLLKLDTDVTNSNRGYHIIANNNGDLYFYHKDIDADEFYRFDVPSSSWLSNCN